MTRQRAVGSNPTLSAISFFLIHNGTDSEWYPRGRRGSPAKGVGVQKAREGSNPSHSAMKETSFVYRGKRGFLVLSENCSAGNLPARTVSTYRNCGQIARATCKSTYSAFRYCGRIARPSRFCVPKLRADCPRCMQIDKSGV